MWWVSFYSFHLFVEIAREDYRDIFKHLSAFESALLDKAHRAWAKGRMFQGVPRLKWLEGLCFCA